MPIYAPHSPKDRLTFENRGTCAIADAEIWLDLSPARGKLVLDVTALTQL
jgi:hypothetical protein